MRLLVIGGRLQGVEAVYLAKKAGFWVRVVDRSRPVPAMEMADEFLQLDVTPDGELARAAAGIDLILPAMENLDALRSLTAQAQVLDLPLAFDLSAYEVSCSKLASDRLFADHKIPAPIPWPACGYPAVVKPSEGSGSEGVRLLKDDKARRTHFGGTFPPPGMVVQEHLEGPSFSVEVIGSPGNYQVLPTTELEMDAGHDCKRVVVPVSLSSKMTTDLAAIGRRCAEVLELTGIMDVEVILHAGRFKVLEVDARLPSQTPISVYHASGINEVALLASLFRNSGFSREACEGRGRAVVFEHIAVSEGELTIRGEHIMGVDQPLRWEMNFFGADEALTTYTPEAKHWVATLIITGNDRDDAWDNHQQVMANLQQAFGLTRMADPTPEGPWHSGDAP